MNQSIPTDGCGSDVAAYALGALPADEKRRFEAHLETCELCRVDLAGLEPVVAALPAAVEPVAPPAALKKQLMRVVEGEARERERESRRQAAERSGRRSWLSFGPVPAMAAACVLLLAGLGVGFAVLGEEGADVVPGECIRGCEDVAMTVEGDHATLKVEGMEEPPEGRVYQVWTQRFGQDPKPTDALFTVDKYGRASVDVPGDADEVDQVLVTDEPRGGSAAPTTAPYFAVKMS